MAKFEDWQKKKDENLILIQGWARDGLTEEQIAHNMGISRSTLNEWKKKDSDISDTLKKGKEISDYEVENALLKKALEGNVVAQIYWLKNRRPDKWREQPKEKVDFEDIPKFVDNIDEE